MFCAPGFKKSKTGCLDRPALDRIVKKYNEYYANNIKKNGNGNGNGNGNKITVSRGVTDEYLWDTIKTALADKCGTADGAETCWLDQDFLLESDSMGNKKTDKFVGQYYKPKSPIGDRTWLSTSNIDGVLKQFERTFPDFAFMGAVPIDFNQILEEFAKIDLCSLYHGTGLHLDTIGESLYEQRKVRQFGVVFNLDNSKQKGSHWVAMFLTYNVKYPYIGFFDSFGVCPPPPEIYALMTKLSEQSQKCLGIKLRLKCNSFQHQFKDSECGMYSIYFIHECLQGRSFEDVTTHKINDDEVNKLRKFYFR